MCCCVAIALMLGKYFKNIFTSGLVLLPFLLLLLLLLLLHFPLVLSTFYQHEVDISTFSCLGIIGERIMTILCIVIQFSQLQGRELSVGHLFYV